MAKLARRPLNDDEIEHAIDLTAQLAHAWGSSCALDLADERPRNFVEIARILGARRRTVPESVVTKALRKLRGRVPESLRDDVRASGTSDDPVYESAETRPSEARMGAW